MAIEPQRMTYQQADDLLHKMYDENHVVAVEVFNHPDSATSENENAIGLWLVGTYADVEEYILAHEETDDYHYEWQYELGSEEGES